jgi:phosphoenolpyruvate synthase/pyruvate phosphate dikinase
MRVTPSSIAGRPPLLGEPAFKTDQAGHKAATLHELAMAGFAVPPAFVIEPHVDMTLYTDDTLAGWVAACGGFPVAVRSSGVIEDLDDASFAGLYESTWTSVMCPPCADGFRTAAIPQLANAYVLI